MSFFLSGLLITYVNPTITKAIVSELPAEWLAVQSLVGSISGLLLGIAWKGKIRKAAIKYFAILAISESLLDLHWLYTYVLFNIMFGYLP